jgi:hypothetical protein
MGYAGSYKDVIYPGPDREPRVLKYRIAFVDEGSPPATHAIIHLVQCDPKNPPPTHLNTALDLLVHRVIDLAPHLCLDTGHGQDESDGYRT